MLWRNVTGLKQVYYDEQFETVTIRTNFSVNDLDLAGTNLLNGFEPVQSIYKIIDEKPDSRVCLVRESSIGDILLMTPVIYHIKEHFPLCRIDIATGDQYLPLHEHVAFVRPVKIQKIKFETYDMGYDFNLSLERAERRGWGRECHRSDIYAKLLGIELDEYKYDIPISKRERDVAKEILHEKGYTEGPLIGYQLRGASASRSMPISKIKKTVQKLTHEKISVVLFDGSRNAGWNGEGIINTCGMLDMRSLFAMIDCCDLVVSTDSGITHIAGALGKKNVAFYACIPAENRVKYENCKVVDLASAYGCKPCWESGERCGQKWSCLREADDKLIYDNIMAEVETR